MFSNQVVIGDILPYTQAIATSGQTVFGTNWTANAASDVFVYHTPFGSPPNDATQQLTSNQFSVAFIGSSQEIQVTLVTPANQGDIITITRQTPADRENLYSNTNFTPTMLNQDFGILTLVDQQAQLVNQLIGPRYNYSAEITPIVDTILPILGENQTWVKNPTGTGIITYTLPQNGIAPSNASYLTLTDFTASLPNSQALSAFGASGILVFNNGTQKVIETSLSGSANQITITNPTGLGTINVGISPNPVFTGTDGVVMPGGTTFQRPISPQTNTLRYNTTEEAYEYFASGVWAQLATEGGIDPGNQYDLAYYENSGDNLSPLATVPAGVLITSSSAPTWASQLPLSLGGTNNSLTASAGGIVWSDSSKLNILTGTSTVGLPLLSGNAATPSWGSFPLSLGGALTTAGSFTMTGSNTFNGRLTGNTNVTFPTSGTLATTSQAVINISCDIGAVVPLSGTIEISGGSTGLMTSGSGAILELVGTLGIGFGGTNKTSVTTLPTATAWAGWDANSNISSNNFLPNYSTTVTAASTTTLTVSSSYLQFFTGTTTQTLVLPVTSTLKLGFPFYVVNNSTGNVTIKSSGGNTIQVMAPGSYAYLTCILTSGTTAASWNCVSSNINPASQYDLAYYATTGSQISGFSTPSDGVLTAVSSQPTWQSTLPLTLGGTGTTLTAANGGIVFTNASSMQVLAPTGTAGLALLSGAGSAPTWSARKPITYINDYFISNVGSNTYTPFPGMVIVNFQICAGGGGSGGFNSASGFGSAVGGGGGGGYSFVTYSPTDIGGSAAIVIGAGGTAGSGSGLTAGGNGGNSSITCSGSGPTITCTGGQGSAAANATTTQGASPGGAPGTATGGTLLNSSGQAGDYGWWQASGLFSQGGRGGSSLFGNGGASIIQLSGNASQGIAATGYGAGGAGGAAAGVTSSSYDGRPGTQGFCLVREYLSL